MQPDRLITRLTYPGGMESGVDLGGSVYVPRRFTCQQTVTHPSRNRAWCRASVLIETNVLTTSPRRYPCCPAAELFL